MMHHITCFLSCFEDFNYLFKYEPTVCAAVSADVLLPFIWKRKSVGTSLIRPLLPHLFCFWLHFSSFCFGSSSIILSVSFILIITCYCCIFPFHLSSSSSPPCPPHRFWIHQFFFLVQNQEKWACPHREWHCWFSSSTEQLEMNQHPAQVSRYMDWVSY